MQMVHFDSGNLVRVLVHVRVWVRFDLQGELRKVGVQLRSIGIYGSSNCANE